MEEDAKIQNSGTSKKRNSNLKLRKYHNLYMCLLRNVALNNPYLNKIDQQFDRVIY